MPTKKGPGSRKSRASGGDAQDLWPQARERIAADRMLQLEICTALESLADNLPNVVDLRLARALVGVIEPSWSEHVSFQDDALFPILLRRHDATRGVAATLERLRLEHAEIRDRHVEVIEQICLLIVGEQPNPDMLGYLLRSVFEGHRRHIEGETAFLELDAPELAHRRRS